MVEDESSYTTNQADDSKIKSKKSKENQLYKKQAEAVDLINYKGIYHDDDTEKF